MISSKTNDKPILQVYAPSINYNLKFSFIFPNYYIQLPVYSLLLDIQALAFMKASQQHTFSKSFKKKIQITLA